MRLDKSKALFEEAKKYIPGGVNSPVRAFGSIGTTPPFMVRGQGSKIYDEDGNEYIDFVSSWGPMMLGHGDERVKNALKEQIDIAIGFGAPTALEVEMAKLITELVPSVEMVRMVNSGTEATMSAIRLARGYTGKDKIVKFAGNYHGHADSFLIQAGSGALTHGVPSSPGIPEDVIKHTLIADYNSVESVQKLFDVHGKEIAAVILEPIVGNMGVVPASQEFIDFLREITQRYGSLLIFDEVMTGFRVSINCAQSLYRVTPDLTCFGKIIGGGLPVGAYGGKREIMEKISPVGPVYQAGTLSGNPVAMSAGLTMLKTLRDNPEIYKNVEEKAKKLQEGIEKNIGELGVEATVNRVGSMITLFFSKEKVYDYNTATKSDTKKYAEYFKSMLEQGIYLPPAQFEAFFISYAHTDEDIERTIQANRKALAV
ncbi:MAG: glutamate-1-semialdehyde-2,1-aminomutase [Candidatus Melainabacteria bacterium RIFOXYA12_FULL_32_12]|nr:MAG: glutamate-1-semialdehyde-2,1-aminomutase [Candidatus Melainabacteria bacterium RIFOXYA2_FULL_32_9]OGI24386.1 MAG: glutamate-1-semialdehyde-2,1-aminomutase [Candidatus Melainabacteria bacterium RIFOXYA12_FULL_32_12]